MSCSADDDDRRVLFGQTLEGRGELVDVGLRPRVQCGAERRLREGQRRHPHRLRLGGDEGVAGGGLRQLRRDPDVTRHELRHLDLLLASLEVEAAEALVRAALHVVGVRVRPERPAEHLHERQAADERVGGRLDDVHDQLAVGRCRAAPVLQGVLAAERRGQQARDLVHQRAHADAAHGADRQHRDHVARGHRSRQRRRDLIAGQLLALEVLLEQRVVRLHDRLDELLARRLDRVRELRRRLTGTRVGAHPRLTAHEADDAGEAVGGADRDRERDHLRAEALTQARQRLVEVRVLAVHPRDGHEARQRARFGLFPRDVGTRLDPGGGVDGDDRRVGGGGAADHLADEVEVARRVDHVEAVAGPLDGEQRERDRVGARVLLGVEVAGGVAVLDAAEAAERARGEEHRLAQHRLPRPAVAHQHDVAELVRRVGVHQSRHPRVRVPGMVPRAGQGGLAELEQAAAAIPHGRSHHGFGFKPV